MVLIVLVAAAVVWWRLSSGDDGDLSSFCAEIEGNRDVLMGITAEQSPGELQAAIPEILGVLDQVVEAAPGEIRDEAARLRDLLRRITELDPGDDEGYAEIIIELNDEETLLDAQRFNEFVATQCRVDLTASTTSAPATTAPAGP